MTTMTAPFDIFKFSSRWAPMIIDSVKPKANHPYIRIKSIALTYGLDPEDVAQQVLDWLLTTGDTFSREGLEDNYIVTSINNKAKLICKKYPQSWLDPDNAFYDKVYIRKCKHELYTASMHDFQLDSQWHAMKIDFDYAVDQLSAKELEHFLSTPDTDHETESIAKAQRARRSDAIDKVHRIMNSFAYARQIKTSKRLEET